MTVIWIPAESDITYALRSDYVALTGYGDYGIPSGKDLAVNGQFDTDSDWTKGSGWTIAGGVAVATAATGNLQESVAALTVGKRYFLTYTIASYTSGSVRTNALIERWTPGTNTESFVATSTFLYFDGVTAFTGSIDNVTLREADTENSHAIYVTRPILSPSAPDGISSITVRRLSGFRARLN